MPDWFYRTVTRPILFRVPARQARNFALGFIGRLARLPLGPAVIDFLGHMRADARLRQSFLGIEFPTAIGLGPWLDTRAVALPALARFGFGFFEVGPVTIEANGSGRQVERLKERQALRFSAIPDTLALAEVGPRLREASRLGLPVMVRLGYPKGVAPERVNEESVRLIKELAPAVQLFSLSSLELAQAEGWTIKQWGMHLRAVLEAARAASPPRPVLLCVRADTDLNAVAPLIEAALVDGISGLVVDGSVAAEADGRLVGLPAREPALEQVRSLRQRWGGEPFIIASGGVHEPDDALALRSAGADLVQVDSGLVYTGPGLPKRINDLLLFEATRSEPPATPTRAPELTWFWTT
ncbi:MAG TPA: hypothetical protein VJ715_05960, partial [Pyrinomonadaceae bacterium]|nr:hypothetical protein [Pyrinomonadaceae bacterium]